MSETAVETVQSNQPSHEQQQQEQHEQQEKQEQEKQEEQKQVEQKQEEEQEQKQKEQHEVENTSTEQPEAEKGDSARQTRSRNRAQTTSSPPAVTKSRAQPAAAAPKKIVVPKGNGKPLKEIPFVKGKLEKEKPEGEFMIELHTLLFGVVGSRNLRRKELLDFSGLTHADEEAKKAFEKNLSERKESFVNQLADIIGVEEAKTQEEKRSAIIQFLDLPKDEGKVLVVATKKRGRKSQKEEENGKAETPSHKKDGNEENGLQHPEKQEEKHEKDEKEEKDEDEKEAKRQKLEESDSNKERGTVAKE